MSEVVPYGSWPSPISAAKVVEGVPAFGEIRADGGNVWWSESRPLENGRNQLVKSASDGARTDLFPAPDPTGPSWNARTKVHEYGGGAWAVRQDVVVFANWDDQRLYRVDPGAEPVPLTPVPVLAHGLRYAEMSWLDDGWLVAVREDHLPEAVAEHDEAVNEIVAIPVDGSAVDDPSRIVTLVTGPDFVAFPTTHGDRLAWAQWNHPDMPWDATEVMVAVITRHHGSPAGISDPAVVGGGRDVSAVQPDVHRRR